MCGIAGIHFKKPGVIVGPQLERFVDKLLLGIEHRGGDATGFVSVAPGAERVILHKEALTAADFIKRRPSLGEGPIRTVLLHTRLATQGHQSNNANNHPVMNGTTFVTHNGHISNDDDVFKDDELPRTAEVDSEAIAAIIQKEGFDHINVALGKLQGGFAIAAVNPIQNPDELILAKGNSSPLIFFENDSFIVWASELSTIKEAWGDTFGTPPRDYKFRQLSAGDIYMFNGAESTIYGFEVKKYESKYKGWTSGVNYYEGGAYGTLSMKEKDVLCFCGHRRFWHAGTDYNDECQNQGVQGKPAEVCSCVEYLAEVKVDPVEKCAGCSSWVDSDTLTDVGNDYSLCESCEPAYGDYFRDSIAEDTDSCTVVTGSSVRKLELVAAPGPRREREKWEPLFEGDEILRHNSILEKVAEETGFNTDFVEWILFRSEIDAVDNDAWLKTAHEECDEAYSGFEEKLNAVEDAAQEALILQ